MPWKECSVMDERLRFVARLLDGEAMTRCLPGVRHLAQDRLQDLQPLQGAWARGAERPLAAAGALRQPAAAADREPDRHGSSATSRIGAPARSASSWSGGWPATSASRPRAPSTPCSTATAWSGAAAGRAIAPQARRSRRARAQRSVVRRLQGRVQARQRPLLLSAHRHRPRLALPAAVRGARIRPARTSPSPPSSSSSASAACRAPSAPTTASPSPAPTPCSTSPSSPSGGSGSASPSSASSPAIRSRTAATSACT